MSLPVVAIVGRPNVGKSHLFNRLVGEATAIVSDEAGTTRDRHFGQVEWAGAHFWLVDTGGLIEDSTIPMDVEIRKQVMQAIAEADLMMLVVDAKVGVHPSDSRIVDLMRQAKKPFVVVANKVDVPESTDYYEFYRLGAGDVLPVSAQNGKGSGDLLDALVAKIPESPEDSSNATRIADSEARISAMSNGFPRSSPHWVWILAAVARRSTGPPGGPSGQSNAIVRTAVGAFSSTTTCRSTTLSRRRNRGSIAATRTSWNPREA